MFRDESKYIEGVFQMVKRVAKKDINIMNHDRVTQNATSMELPIWREWGAIFHMDELKVSKIIVRKDVRWQNLELDWVKLNFDK